MHFLLFLNFSLEHKPKFYFKLKPDIRKRELWQTSHLENTENSSKSSLMSTFVQPGKMKSMWNDGLKSEMEKKVKL